MGDDDVEKSLLIAGFGGQGVMSMGQMLGYAASDAGKNATYYPSYGAEQRGGTANCTVIISDEEIGSPVASKLDVVIAMNEPSFNKFKGKVKKGGTLLVNSSLVESKLERDDISAVYIPANDIATELGSSKVANIVMLGAYIKVSGVLSVEETRAIITKVLGKKADMLASNLKAFETGYGLA